MASTKRSRRLTRPSLSPIPDTYFGDELYDSPDDSCASDDTLSDEDMESPSFGYPLQRMPRNPSTGEDYFHDLQVTALLRISPSRSASLNSPVSAASYDSINYEQVIEEILKRNPNPFLLPDPRNMVSFSPLGSVPSIMVKQLSRSSTELLLLLELNHPELRGDPWNPVPHILSAVERHDQVYLCMQSLCEYNHPSLLNVAQYLDLFRQILEGLSFLHEQRVAGLSFSESSLMVDITSAPRTASDISSASFDRFSYPVRYYFVNYSEAFRIPVESTPSAIPSERESLMEFRKDVTECGELFEQLLMDVPQVAQKFKSLTRGMIHGDFTADNSRRLFEALCRSLDAGIFESKVDCNPHRLERAHTLSQVTSPRSTVSSRKLSSP